MGGLSGSVRPRDGVEGNICQLACIDAIVETVLEGGVFEALEDSICDAGYQVERLRALCDQVWFWLGMFSLELVHPIESLFGEKPASKHWNKGEACFVELLAAELWWGLFVGVEKSSCGPLLWCCSTPAREHHARPHLFLLSSVYQTQ